MKCSPYFCQLIPTALLAACAGAPQVAYESDPDAMNQSSAVDSGEARALEQAEADCARQGKHAVSKRVEGETIYDCTEGD
jgi:hypothetical protein